MLDIVPVMKGKNAVVVYVGKVTEEKNGVLANRSRNSRRPNF